MHNKIRSTNLAHFASFWSSHSSGRSEFGAKQHHQIQTEKGTQITPTFNYINNLPSKSIQTVNSLNQLILIMPHPAQISTPAIIN
jgi:hypothetical protein